jgi:hypothetical protein
MVYAKVSTGTPFPPKYLHNRERIMIIRRRTWFYRLAGQRFAQAVTFTSPMPAARVREALCRTVGVPLEIWGRNAQPFIG